MSDIVLTKCFSCSVLETFKAKLDGQHSTQHTLLMLPELRRFYQNGWHKILYDLVHMYCRSRHQNREHKTQINGITIIRHSEIRFITDSLICLIPIKKSNFWMILMLCICLQNLPVMMTYRIQIRLSVSNNLKRYLRKTILSEILV